MVSGVLALSQSSSVARVDSLSALQELAIPVINNSFVAVVSGQSGIADGGYGGVFVYSSAATDTTNTYSVFKPTTGNGRWLRIAASSFNQKNSVTVSDASTYAFLVQRNFGTNALAVGADNSQAYVQSWGVYDLHLNGTGTNRIAIGNGATTRITVFKTVPDNGGEYFDVTPVNQTTQSENRYGQRVLYQIDNANPSHAHSNGALLSELFVPTSNSQNYSSRHSGVYGYVHHAGSGNLSDARGIYSVIGTYGAGNIASGYGIYLQGGQDATSSGKFTDYYGGYVTPFLVSGSGAAPANFYGFYVASQTGATNNYAFYSAGTTPSQLGGTLTLGASSNALIVSNSQTPASASASGTTGTVCWDANFVYVCVAPNTWKRSALATW